MTGIPPVRRRLLGSALRKYRESLGYNLDQAARILDCDRSKVSRIETGQRGIRAKELRELLTDYGVPAGEQEALLAIAHSGRRTGWWTEYADVLSEAGQDYVIMEVSASGISGFEPNLVPDLLQTPEYAGAVAGADANRTCDAQRARAVEVTLARQRTVLGNRAAELEFVITEGALRQAVGGPPVMRAQLAALTRIAETGIVPRLPGDDRSPGAGARVGVRVLPFAAGAHPAAGCGSLMILRFAQSPGIGAVHLSGLCDGVSLEGREVMERYLRTFALLRTAALSPADSARLLRAMLAQQWL